MLYALSGHALGSFQGSSLCTHERAQVTLLPPNFTYGPGRGLSVFKRDGRWSADHQPTAQAHLSDTMSRVRSLLALLELQKTNGNEAHSYGARGILHG